MAVLEPMAVGRGTSLRAAPAPSRAGASTSSRLGPAARELAAVAGAALPLALVAPGLTAVVGLVALGVAHNVFELRYVLGRFRAVLTGPFLQALLVPVTLIAFARLGAFGASGRTVEVLAGFTVVGLGIARGWSRVPRGPAVGMAASAGGLAVLSLAHPEWYALGLAQLHNLVAAFFLWEWARFQPHGDDDRRSFGRAQLAVFGAVPALILAGAFDWLLPATPGAGAPGEAIARAVTLPGWAGSPLAMRALAAYTFLQLLHYATWCWLLPRHAPDVTARVAAELPAGRALTGRPLALLVAAATATAAFVFATEFATGRTLYSALATYHAYLELPVIVVLLAGWPIRAAVHTGGTRVPR